MIRAHSSLASSVSSFMLLGLIGAMIYVTQIRYDTARFNRLRNNTIPINELIEPTLPNPEVIKNVALGFEAALADLFWLQTIQYYGGGDPYAKYRQLPNLIRAIITLDPKFKYPYSFAGLVMPSEGYPDEALAILEKGEQVLPNDWEMSYHIGSIYLIQKQDPQKAAPYYKRASTKPGAPDIAALLSAIQYEKSDDTQIARAMFQELADKSNNEYVKNRAKLHVEHYQLLDDLKAVITEFKTREKRYPSSLDELVSKHYIEFVPQDPLNQTLEYSADSGELKSRIKE